MNTNYSVTDGKISW